MVIIGRNDDYTVDYLYRLSNTLCFLAFNLAKLDRLHQMEVIVVDWGSKIPLSEVLDLTGDAIEISRFVNVSEKLAQEVSPDSVFHSTRAVNVGIRRSVGRYAMLADTDSLMPLPSLRSLLDLLEGIVISPIPIERAYLHIRRYQVPWQIAWRRPSVRMWNRYCTLLSSGLLAERTAVAASCLGGFAAAQLLHRDLWEELGGYDESLTQTWGWCDNDLVIRLSQKYLSVDLALFGVYSMHVEHLPKHLNTKNVTAGRSNPMRINCKLRANEEDWGLINYKRLRVLKAERSSERIRHLGEDLDFLPLNRRALAEFTSQEFLPEDFRTGILKKVGDVELPSRETELMVLLAFYSIQFKPVNLYWIGPLSIFCLTPALAISKGMECYLLNIWENGIQEMDGKNNPASFSRELTRAGYCGYSRILLGDVVESLDRIHAESLGYDGIELAYISDELGEFEFKKAFRKVLKSLVQNGAIVVTRCERVPEEKSPAPCSISRWFEENAFRLLRYKPNRDNFVDVCIAELLKYDRNAKAYMMSSRKTILIVRSSI